MWTNFTVTTERGSASRGPGSADLYDCPEGGGSTGGFLIAEDYVEHLRILWAELGTSSTGTARWRVAPRPRGS